MTLRIGTQIYNGGTQLVASVGSEADGFESSVNTALTLIRSTGEGAGLLSAIESAGQEVQIVKAGQNQPNTCVQSQQSEQSCDAACYQEVLAAQNLYNKIQELINKKLSRRGTLPS